MEDLVALLESAQDGNRVFDIGLVDHHGLEPAFKRRIRFDVFAVFIQRRGADAVQLAAREHGLQQVAGVHRAVCLPGADDVVQFVDEQDHLAFAALHFVQHSLQPLFELAPEFSACDERAHIEGEDRLVLEAFRDVTPQNPLRQPFGNRRLPDAGFADEDRVVLRLSRQDADHVSNLFVTPDHGIELLLPRLSDEVETVLAERIVRVFGIVAGHAAGLDRRQRLEELLFADAEVLKQQRQRRRGLLHER